MNGQNGTEFDWYVNDRLSSFMVFYNDEANLGAVKLYLNRSATADVFLYGEQGKKFLKQVTVPVEATEQELLELAVLLRREADDKRLWDADIEALNAEQTAALRRKCFESDVKLVVVKNTLLAKALEKAEKADAELVKVLEGPTSVMFAHVAKAPAVLIKEFRKTSDKPVLKAAFAEGCFTWATISWTLCVTSSRRRSLSAISSHCSSLLRRMLFLHCRLMQAKRLRDIVKTLESRNN